jgi:hypothetical protein
MVMRCWSSLVTAALLTVTFLNSPVASREILVDVKAPWNQRNIDSILEIGEFISNHSPENFWEYISSLCTTTEVFDRALMNTSYAAQQEVKLMAQFHGKKVLSTNIHNLMTAAVLNLEMYAPTTAFYESITQHLQSPCGDGQAYIISYPTEQIICLDPGKVLVAVEEEVHEDNFTAKWDYRYPSSSSVDTAKIPTMILHGIPGTSSFCSLHHQLVALSHSDLVNYIFRPAFPGIPIISSSRPLRGYGVFLDIKNMEYKNADDKDEGAASAGSTSADEGPSIQFEKGEEVKGIIFSTLQERRPELTKELSILREEILADAVNADGVTEMKVLRPSPALISPLSSPRCGR